jgi:hypothetical protein
MISQRRDYPSETDLDFWNDLKPSQFSERKHRSAFFDGFVHYSTKICKTEGPTNVLFSATQNLLVVPPPRWLNPWYWVDPRKKKIDPTVFIDWARMSMSWSSMQLLMILVQFEKSTLQTRANGYYDLTDIRSAVISMKSINVFTYTIMLRVTLIKNVIMG